MDVLRQTISWTACGEHHFDQPELSSSSEVAETVGIKHRCRESVVVIVVDGHVVGNPGNHGDIHVGNQPEGWSEYSDVRSTAIKAEGCGEHGNPSRQQLHDALQFQALVKGTIDAEKTLRGERGQGLHLDFQLGTKREAQVTESDERKLGQRGLDRAAGRRLHISPPQHQRLFEVPLILDQFINGDCLGGARVSRLWISDAGKQGAVRANRSVTDLKNSANLWVHHSSGEHQISANLDIGIRNFDACLFELDA